MVRFAVRSRCGGHATSTASVVLAGGRALLGDLERVREEVALGHAEVAAVEPDVAVVEDAVEGQEARGARLGRCGSKVRR